MKGYFFSLDGTLMCFGSFRGDINTIDSLRETLTIVLFPYFSSFCFLMA
jgi:hypothetical protein